MRSDEASLPGEVVADSNQYLTFRVSGDRFAVDILAIQEILEVGQMTSVPLAPSYIRGVFNLRGSVLPVVDLSVRLGRESRPLSKRSCVVVVETRGESAHALGLLVDEVNEILEIPPDQVKPPPDLGESRGPGLVQAMGRIEDSLIVLLDIDQVMRHEDMGHLETLSELAGVVAGPEAGDE